MEKKYRKSTEIFLVIILGFLFHSSHCQYYNQHCGTLFAETNFGGQNISFSDRDQTISLHDDQKSATGSWGETKSISIQSSCSMEICNETYFDGNCLTLSAGSYPTIDMNITDIASVSCTCEKECNCNDVYMKQTSCARAYLEGGCTTCHSLYVEMNNTTPMPERNLPKLFPEDYSDRVTVIKLRKGCSLTLHPPEESDQDEVIIESELFDLTGESKMEIGGYECSCDDSQFVPRSKPPRDESYPPLVEIPGTMDEIIKMMMNEKYTNHPGLRAAHQSLKNKRSPRNAYILLVGSTGSGKSSAINLLFDNPNVTRVGERKSTTTDIHEFRIPVAIDEFGVANSELRVIDTPGLGDTRGTGNDAMFLATLEDYLASHEELKDRIPNVVLVFHKFSDNRFTGEGAPFVQMLRGLDTFRDRITDENFSNVIFVLSHFCSETKRTQRKPETRLAQFKDTIENFSLFPKPIQISVAENRPDEQDLPMVNGYAKLPNNEYYPRNLFDKMEIVTSKGGDPIGQGVFRTAFRNSDDFNISSITFKLLPNQNERVSYYLKVLSDGQMGVVDTEMSRLLQHVWEEKVDAKLKRNFPTSLSYLQKVLNLRKVNTMDDVPRTATGILELMTAIKHDEATRVLLDKGLGIKPPAFPSNTIVGHSYDVFKDTHLTNSPFIMGDLKQSDIGFLVPDSISVKLEPGDGEHFHLFDTKQEYLQSRLKSLGIDGSISEQNFTGVIKPGHNIKSISFKNDSCSLTATREVKLFEFVLNDRPKLTQEFQNRVKSLPLFNSSDYDTVSTWNRFFNDYGTHVVRSIYGGGAIQIELKSNKPYDSQLSKTLFDLIKFAEEMSFLIVHTGNKNETSRGVINSGVDHSLKFIGGDATYYTTDLTKMSVEAAAKLLTNWKKSLKYQPAVLTTEMRLVPLGQVVKKLGQNYSSEIERASSLLFNSNLTYVPPKKNPVVVQDSRDRMMDLISKQMDSHNKMIQNLMESMQKLEIERQKRDQEIAEKRQAWEKEERERARKYEIERLAAQQKSEQERKEWEKKMEEIRRKDNEERARRQAALAEEQRNFQLKMQERNEEFLRRLTSTTPRPWNPPSGSRCLAPGTRILMADGTEKVVEKLKAGDIILDVDLKPTTVIGVNFEFIGDGKLYGFDVGEYFFTEEHLFAGPAIDNSSQSNMQLYAYSRNSLLKNNPLMRYWDVKGMTEIEKLQIFHYNRSQKSAEDKSVEVFEDPRAYPPETPVYFILVDSPSATYFANGYVCKVDVPPVEMWPHTMSVLFNLMRSRAAEKLYGMPYSLETVDFMRSVAANISEAVEDRLQNMDWDNINAEENEYSLMTLENEKIDECLYLVFNEPTVAALALPLYGRLGNVISSRLDADGVQNDVEFVAKVQHDLYEFISKQLDAYSIVS